MKLFGYELKKASPAAAANRGRITSPASTDFGWLGTKLSPTQVRSLLNGMRAGSFTDGYELFSEMQDTWHTLAKNLQQLREAVAAVPYQVVAAIADGAGAASTSATERAAVCRQALQNFLPDPAGDENGFEDFVYDLTDALVLGVSVQELIWEQAADLVRPRATVWVHPNQYALGTDGRLGLTADSAATTIYGSSRATIVTPFPADRFIVASYKTRSGARTVGGLLRPLAWWWCANQFGRDWVLRNAELFGQPIRDIEYDVNIKPEDLAELKLLAANMGSTAWLTRPSGTKLTLIEAQKTGDNSPQADLLDRADRACDLMILWQTLTSNTGPTGGGSLALGQVHAGVLDARKQNIANWAANIVSYQLFPAICRANYGEADECPVLKADHTQPESGKEKADRLKVAKEIVPLPKTWTYDQLGIPVPATEEDTIAIAVPAPAPFAFRARRSELHSRPAADPRPAAASLRAADSRPATPQSISPQLADASRRLLAAAQAADLAPVRARLETILALADETAFKAELAALQKELPALLPKNPQAAVALEKIMGTALLNGLTEKRMKAEL